jgi:hypothetical protein
MAGGGLSGRERRRRAGSEATGARAAFDRDAQTIANLGLISWLLKLRPQESWQSNLQLLPVAGR